MFSIQKVKQLITKRIFIFGAIMLLAFSATAVFAGNPAAPIVPSDNIQDPGDTGTAWGGCGPTDPNCYVTVPLVSLSGENYLTISGQTITAHPVDLSGSNVTGILNVTHLGADSIGDTQLAFNTGQNLTTASSPTFTGLTVSGLAGGGTKCLQTNNSGVISANASACGGGGGGTPGGADTDVQFNDGGTFGGEDSFTFDKNFINLAIGDTSTFGGSSSYDTSVGSSISTDGNYNAAFGFTHSITGDYNLLGGNRATIHGGYNIVAGSQLTVGSGIEDTDYSAVFGNQNSLAGDISGSPYSLVAGSNNDLTESGYSLVAGSDNNLDTAPYSFVFGSQNTIDGSGGSADYSVALGGYLNTITGDASYALGHDMTVAGNGSFGINLGGSNAQYGSGTPYTVSNNGVFVVMGGNVGIGDVSPAALLTVGNGDKFQVDANGQITSASLAGSGTKCLQTNNSGVVSFAAAACGSGGSMAIGGAVTSGTAGSVLFVDGSGNLAQNNSNFFWDNSAKSLGIGGQAQAGAFLHIKESTAATAVPTSWQANLLLTSTGCNNEAIGVLATNFSTDVEDGLAMYQCANGKVNFDVGYGTSGNKGAEIIMDPVAGNVKVNGSFSIFDTTNHTSTFDTSANNSLIFRPSSPTDANLGGHFSMNNVVGVGETTYTNSELITAAKADPTNHYYDSSNFFGATDGAITNSAFSIGSEGNYSGGTFSHYRFYAWDYPNNQGIFHYDDVTPNTFIFDTGINVLVAGSLNVQSSTTSPYLFGGFGASSTLTLQSTYNASTVADSIVFVVGNNGAPTTAMTINHTGNVGVGDATPAALFTVGNGDKFQVDGNGAITSASLAGSGTKCLQTNNSGVISAAAGACGGGGVALSSMSAATGPNTIASGNNSGQVWNWALTTDSVSAFKFGETTAATSGTSDNQRILELDTLASSTAVPLFVSNSGAADSFIVYDGSTKFRIDNAGNVVVGSGSVASAAGINFTVAAGAPAQVSASAAGANLTLAASNATAGSASGFAAGGTLAITAGNAAVAGGAGGGAAGGAITITGGNGANVGSNSGDGGNITITGGSASGTGSGGSLFLNGAASTSAGNAPGNVTIAGGAASANGSVGGTVTIKSGAGTTNTNSGNISIVTGTPTASGTSGTITIAPAQAPVISSNQNGQASGGVVTITAGKGQDQSFGGFNNGGNGAALNLAAGAGGNQTGGQGTGGNGATATFAAGAGGSNTAGSGATRVGGNGGDALIVSGIAGTGASANGTDGNIIFKTGGSSGTERFRIANTGLATFTGSTLNTDADLSVGVANFTNTITKNDANTRTFPILQIKPTINTGGSNTTTTLNLLNIDTTNTSVTGVTTNLIKASYGGTQEFLVNSSGAITSQSLAGGGAKCLHTDNNGLITAAAADCGGGMSIGGSITSATQGSILYAGASGVLTQDNSNFFWDDTNHRMGLGVNSSLKSVLHIVGSTTASGSNAIAGIYGALTLTNSTGSGSQFGNRTEITVNGGTAGSEIGQFIKVTDSTALANTVRGLEVQAFSGTNTAGTNTGIAAFGKTFGIQATTTGEAGGVSVPAALFADLDNSAAPTAGNAIRAYTNDATAANLVSLYQETSAFTGTGLVANFGNNSGSFSGNFLDFQKAGTSKFTVANTGRVDILAADADNIIPLYINSEESTASQTLFAIESDTTNNSQTVDTVKAHFEADGKLYVSLPGTANTVALCHSTAGLANNDQIVDCSGAPSDIAEWYETNSDVELGDLVSVTDSRIDLNYASGIGTVIDADGNKTDEVPLPGNVRSMAVLGKATAGTTMIGVVSTAPYQTFGEDVLKNSTHPERIALAGRVPVKVTDENGAVKAGDTLVLSKTKSGYAMKQTASGESIGVALEDSKTSDGNILVFLNVGYRYVGVTMDTSGNQIVFDRGLDLGGNSILNVKSISSSLRNWSIDADGNLIVKKVQTDQLCIGTTCVDEATLKALLLNQNAGNPSPPNLGGVPAPSGGGGSSDPTPPDNTTPPPSDGGTPPNLGGEGSDATPTPDPIVAPPDTTPAPDSTSTPPPDTSNIPAQ